MAFAIAIALVPNILAVALRSAKATPRLTEVPFICNRALIIALSTNEVGGAAGNE
jgi:hypothetical protein